MIGLVRGRSELNPNARPYNMIANVRFIPTNAWRHFRALMREGRVLMRDVVATYHEGAASRNWFYRLRVLSRTRAGRSKLTQGGVTF